jgi:alpha-glucosidase (family GH31 glycosyl hydrolase)
LTYEKNQGKYASYVSESGGLELFMFASTTSGYSPYNGQAGFNRFKKVQQDLAIISGYVPLPQYHALGYHFSKWIKSVSAEMIIERNRNFTEFGFPLDVLWMDIEWADQYSEEKNVEYFIFNP